MAIPAASMAVGCAIALPSSLYRKRWHEQRETRSSSGQRQARRDEEGSRPSPPSPPRFCHPGCFKMDSEATCARALVGLCMMPVMRVAPWQQPTMCSAAAHLFIGLIMITARGLRVGPEGVRPD